MQSNLIQYLIVRRDLIEKFKWNIGSIIAQACHASLAVIYEHINEKNTNDYLRDSLNMRKVVLQVNNQEELNDIHKKLTDSLIGCFLWIEQPENIPTAIATVPSLKDDVFKTIGHLKLFK